MSQLNDQSFSFTRQAQRVFPFENYIIYICSFELFFQNQLFKSVLQNICFKNFKFYKFLRSSRERVLFQKSNSLQPAATLFIEGNVKLYSYAGSFYRKNLFKALHTYSQAYEWFC